MTRAQRPRNAVLCKDCGLSVWDVDGDCVYFSCGQGYTGPRLVAVSTARRLLMPGCPRPVPAQRFGGRPGDVTVFDVASGRRPDDVHGGRPGPEAECVRRPGGGKDMQMRLGDFIRPPRGVDAEASR